MVTALRFDERMTLPTPRRARAPLRFDRHTTLSVPQDNRDLGVADAFELLQPAVSPIRASDRQFEFEHCPARLVVPNVDLAAVVFDDVLDEVQAKS